MYQKVVYDYGKLWAVYGSMVSSQKFAAVEIGSLFRGHLFLNHSTV